MNALVGQSRMELATLLRRWVEQMPASRAFRTEQFGPGITRWVIREYTTRKVIEQELFIDHAAAGDDHPMGDVMSMIAAEVALAVRNAA